jgi:hypothetical protein
MQARKEFHIAFNIQPMGFSAAGRLSIAVANAFYKSGDRALRIEALQYSNTYLQRPQVDGADPFENSATLKILDSEGIGLLVLDRNTFFKRWEPLVYCIQDPYS